MRRKKTTSIGDSILTDDQIKTRLSEERAGIEADVDRAIENFIANGNKTYAKNVLKVINAGKDRKQGFRAWQSFASTGDLVSLRADLHDWSISALGHDRMENQALKTEQGQDGKRRSVRTTAARTLRAGFHAASARRHKGDALSRGDLSVPQELAFETLLNFRRMFDGPSVDIIPLTTVLAPYLKKAVMEKLTTSYEELKQNAGKPLIDEEVVRSLRDEVLRESLSRFDMLNEETYGPQNTPMPVYQFDASQMPDATQFGIEIEGFSALDQTFPGNLETLSRYLQENGLAASTSLTPKSDTAYDTWSMTEDFSIVNPLHFNARYRSRPTVISSTSSFELVSPILHGQDGEKQLLQVTDLLRSVKFRSNDSCGLHMHVGIKEASLEEKKNLVKALYANEAAIDALISPERRGDGNKFAHSHRTMKVDEVDRAATIEELVNIINPGNDRNYKFDMTGLVLPNAPPTVQYRCAGGAAYLNTVGDYAVILANFTEQALHNPDIRLENVVAELVHQRDEMRAQREAPATIQPQRQPRAAHP